MWIHKGDTLVNKKNEILEVLEISGLYASASLMTISLKNQKTKEILNMSYINEFCPKVESNELKPFEIKKKANRGYY